jgi:tRNA nucleotidyltransferase (CCA-adding enzyme)
LREELTKPSKLLVRLEKSLPPGTRRALDVVLTLGEEEGRTIYTVGGGVRDLALGRPQVDVDLVAEGEVLILAERAAARLGARRVAHGAFGTVTLAGDDFRLDLAMTRAESYSRPGALPTVRPASIEQDLARRDFSINAMALALCGSERGRLLDPFDGMGDLERGVVRVLHDRSFVDDATRILRAVRYEARLSFRIEDDTLALLGRDLSYLDTISGARLRQELLHILAEEEPKKALGRCQELGVLAGMHRDLRFDEGLSEALRQARQEGEAKPRPELYLALLGTRLSPPDAAAVAGRLALSKRQRQALEGAAALAELIPWLAQPDLRASQAVQRLESYPPSTRRAWALVASHPLARERLGLSLRVWRYVKPRLDGRALERLGVRRGPRIGDLLRFLRAARLDGEVKTRDDEVEMVRRILRQEGEEG